MRARERGERASEPAIDQLCICVCNHRWNAIFLAFSHENTHREASESEALSFSYRRFAGVAGNSWSALASHTRANVYRRYSVFLLYFICSRCWLLPLRFRLYTHCMCWSVRRPIGLNVASLAEKRISLSIQLSYFRSVYIYMHWRW